jgi:hypothetical protein
MRRDAIILLALVVGLVAYFALFGRYIQSDDEVLQARHLQAFVPR